MNKRRQPGLTFKLLLMTVLLTAQGFAFAHGMDHLLLDDSSNCVVCAVGSVLDSGAVETSSAVQAAPAISITAVPLNACLPEQFPVRRPARGPPHSL